MRTGLQPLVGGWRPAPAYMTTHDADEAAAARAAGVSAAGVGDAWQPPAPAAPPPPAAPLPAPAVTAEPRVPAPPSQAAHPVDPATAAATTAAAAAAAATAAPASPDGGAFVARYRRDALPALRRAVVSSAACAAFVVLLVAGLAARSLALCLVGGAGTACTAYLAARYWRARRALQHSERLLNPDAYWDLEQSLPAHAWGGL